MEYFQNLESFWSLIKPLLEGTGVTLQIFAFTLVLAIPLGFIICSARMSKIKPLKWLSQLYILIFRGTPLLLQLMFFYFGLIILGVKIDRTLAAVIAFVLNYAAYFGEIFRGGMQSIPKGQYEAAQVLGFSTAQTFFKIVLPQVAKRVLPPMGNEVITLVKDTALVYTVSVQDLLREGSIIMTRDSLITPLIVAAVFYLIMTSTFTFVFNKLETKMNYYTI